MGLKINYNGDFVSVGVMAHAQEHVYWSIQKDSKPIKSVNTKSINHAYHDLWRYRTGA